MIKTKFLYSYRKSESDGKLGEMVLIDQAINDFIKEERIDANRLIDIKFAPTGYFQENNGEGDIDPSALVIYRERSNFGY